MNYTEYKWFSPEEAYQMLMDSPNELRLTTCSDFGTYPQFFRTCGNNIGQVIDPDDAVFGDCWKTKEDFLRENSGEKFRVVF